MASLAWGKSALSGRGGSLALGEVHTSGMPSLHARTSLAAESVFSRMSRLALEHGAINLGQGFPSSPPPEFLVQAARHFVGRIDQYSPPAGLAALREAVAADLSRPHASVSAEQVVVTCGATEALNALAATLYGPGDEVVAFEPVFDIYAPQATLAGATYVGVPLRLSGQGWQLDLGALARAITPRTRAMVVNSPFNPTGSVFSAEELAEVVALARANDLWLIADEVYDELYYAAPPTPLRTLAPERTFTVGSAGKRLEATGWRVGWVVAPPGLASEVAGLHQWTTFCAPAPLQAAVAQALEAARQSEYYPQLRASYAQRLQHLSSGLTELGAQVYISQGTYFLTARLAGVDAETLVTKAKVATIPLSAFYRQHAPPPEVLRFAFCKSESEIEQALTQLRQYLA